MFVTLATNGELFFQLLQMPSFRSGKILCRMHTAIAMFRVSQLTRHYIRHNGELRTFVTGAFQNLILLLKGMILTLLFLAELGLWNFFKNFNDLTKKPLICFLETWVNHAAHECISAASLAFHRFLTEQEGLVPNNLERIHTSYVSILCPYGASASKSSSCVIERRGIQRQSHDLIKCCDSAVSMKYDERATIKLSGQGPHTITRMKVKTSSGHSEV